MTQGQAVAVIGAGIGGLSAAIDLARRGIRVQVYEQADAPGGKAGELRRKGFRFDTGPSLLTMPFVIDELLNDAGVSSELRPKFAPLASLCRYVFPDGTTFDAGAGPDSLAEALAHAFGEAPDRVRRYLEDCRCIYDLTADMFLFRPVAGLLDMVTSAMPPDGLRALVGLNKIGFFSTTHTMHARSFADPRTVQLFDRYATYVGSDPYRTPATYNTIQHVEYGIGGYTVDGGISALVESLVKAAQACGVEFAFGCPVRRILVADGQATGVVTDAGEVRYPCIISDVDALTTFRGLLAPSGVPVPRRFLHRPLSSSAVVFYWGVKGVHTQVDIHNVLFSEDYRAEFEDIFRRHRTPEDPTVYVHLSCRHTPEDAPAGHENWFVMVNAPADRGQDWGEEVANVRDTILRRIRQGFGVDLREAIVTESVLTPPDLERRTGAHGGSLYGPASHGLLAPFKRQANRCREIGRLYFSGGTAHPGGGIPLAVLSGRFAACLASADRA